MILIESLNMLWKETQNHRIPHMMIRFYSNVRTSCSCTLFFRENQIIHNKEPIFSYCKQSLELMIFHDTIGLKTIIFIK